MTLVSMTDMIACLPNLLSGSSSLLRHLLGLLLLPRDASLDTNAAKDKSDTKPLHLREAVAEGGDGEYHGEHLAGDGDGDEEDGGERG